MVIIIITRLLATSRIITQYFDHLLLFNFTTSPLKIDEPLSTFQFCHLWLGTFGNWYEFLIVGFLSMCFKWYSVSRRKTKALQGANYAIKSNKYPSLVLVQPKKTRPYITERLLMGRKESNQTNKQRAISIWTDVPWYFCDKESYLSWLTFINVAYPYMQPTYFLHLLSFP